MRDGFIKVGCASVPITVANPHKNADNIIKIVNDSENKKIKLLVLPELCLTGYTCGDLFGYESLIRSAEKELIRIVNETSSLDVVFAVGLPIMKNEKLYNCAAVVHSGEVIGIVPKTNLPDYSEFYEERQFTTGKDVVNDYYEFENGSVVPFSNDLVFSEDSIKNYTFGIEICEDLWAPQQTSVALTSRGANIILNLSASNEIIGKAEYRRKLVTSTSARLICGYVYADASPSESTQDLIFASHDIIADYGTIIAENKPFGDKSIISSDIDVDKISFERHKSNSFVSVGSEKIHFTQIIDQTVLERDFPKSPFVPSNADDRNSRCEMILDMQSYGLKKRIEHTGIKKLAVNISGGLDSTLALIVSSRALKLAGLPSNDLIALTLPCFGTTVRTKSNAEKLAVELGADLRTIDIKSSVIEHFKAIGQNEELHDVTYENAQARERTQVLMDVANKCSALAVGTGDLSELALGWCTYNGDHMSMYGVNSSIPKTLVRYLIKYAADSYLSDGMTELSETLISVLDTPVSPELIPPKENGEIQQITEDIVGPYELHDFFLYYFLRCGYPADKVFRIAKIAFAGVYTDDTIEKWLRMFVKRFFSQQFKRSCMPDGVKVGTVSLSPRGDWRMPSDADSSIFEL